MPRASKVGSSATGPPGARVGSWSAAPVTGMALPGGPRACTSGSGHRRGPETSAALHGDVVEPLDVDEAAVGQPELRDDRQGDERQLHERLGDADAQAVGG